MRPVDREIVSLAVPALGALAAEPLYLLVDTAIVGHLGTRELAALALAATVLSSLASLCIFLTYGTTAQVARLHGAGEQARAGEIAAQALFIFSALILDAIAIAAQVLVGRALGAGDSARAVAAGWRAVVWGFGAGCVFGAVLLALAGVLPEAFTSDARVLDRADVIWPLFAFMQAAAGVVFALDGVLMGASDTRYLAWAMTVAGLGTYAPLALLALGLHWGIAGVWGACWR